MFVHFTVSTVGGTSGRPFCFLFLEENFAPVCSSLRLNRWSTFFVKCCVFLCRSLELAQVGVIPLLVQILADEEVLLHIKAYVAAALCNLSQEPATHPM